MGGTCAPGENEEEQEECNMEVGEDQTIEKFTEIINKYQVDNEALKKQLEECRKVNDEEEVEDKEEKARQNDEVMKELETMKALVEAKDAMLVKGRLEAALLSKATTMLATEATTKLCMKGALKNVYKAGLGKSKRKTKWVEIHTTEGEFIGDEFVSGFVMITSSDSKDSATSNRYQVKEVIAVDDSKSRDSMFTLKLSSQGTSKDMVFECDDVEERDEWVKMIIGALDEVKAAYEALLEEFTFTVKFEKEKLGFRVAENVIETKECEEKVEFAKEEEVCKEVVCMVEASAEVAEKVVEKTADAVAKEVEKKVGAEEVKETKEEEQIQDPPCRLTVSDILDPELATKGVKSDFEIRMINDIYLPGKGYTEQLEMLQKTKKPFEITFAGMHCVKKGNSREHAYTSIFKELVAEEDNSVKTAFNELIKGTPFEEELKASVDQTATINALLANQRRLLALIQNCQVKEVEL